LAVSDPGSRPPGGTAPGDTISDLGSLDDVDPRFIVLGLLGYPGMSSAPASWRWVEGSRSCHVRRLQLCASYSGK
jgi:hypothetical protein